jgi:hypothetical protein
LKQRWRRDRFNMTLHQLYRDAVRWYRLSIKSAKSNYLSNKALRISATSAKADYNIFRSFRTTQQATIPVLDRWKDGDPCTPAMLDKDKANHLAEFFQRLEGKPDKSPRYSEVQQHRTD